MSHNGLLDLVLEQRGGITRPVTALAHPPIQLSRVRYDAPGTPETACFTLLHLGGVLEGDRAELRVTLHPGASAQITMAAATQIYRMPAGDAAHHTHVHAAPSSRVLWLAEPLILFGGSRFSQSTTITLAAGAQVDWFDILVPGRLARGERDQFERYVMQFEVQDEAGQLLVAEQAALEPQRWPLPMPGVRGDMPVIGSLFMLDRALDVADWAAQINQREATNCAATALPNGCGMLLRVLGTTPSGVRDQLRALWRAVRS